MKTSHNTTPLEDEPTQLKKQKTTTPTEENIDRKVYKLYKEVTTSPVFIRVKEFQEKKQISHICSDCASNFELLTLVNDAAIFAKLGHRCGGCTEYCCYGCILRRTLLNPYNHSSIGYMCDTCGFANFGLVDEVPECDMTNDISFFPPVHGYSTGGIGDPFETSGSKRHSLPLKQKALDEHEAIFNKWRVDNKQQLSSDAESESSVSDSDSESSV